VRPLVSCEAKEAGTMRTHLHLQFHALAQGPPQHGKVCRRGHVGNMEADGASRRIFRRVPFHLLGNIHATGPLYFPAQPQNHTWTPQILQYSSGTGARRMLEHTTSTWLLTAGCGSKASPAPLLSFPGRKVGNTHTGPTQLNDPNVS
jgi:hypothetical protein